MFNYFYVNVFHIQFFIFFFFHPEQTSEEIERTKQFADEVIELMRHTTNCSMAFNKFIPSYHHHFGKQCRVADYGFTKLIELFEVIPNILEVSMFLSFHNVLFSFFVIFMKILLMIFFLKFN